MKNKQTLLIFIVLLISCSMNTENKKDKKYEWHANGNAPSFYPTTIFFGDFIFADGKKLYIPKVTQFAGEWGIGDGTHVLNNNFFPAPAGIDIIWFSFVEKQFYSLQAELPKDKIDSLLSEINETTKEKKYGYIIAGMAPYGGLAVWLSGYGIKTEVAWLQAEPTYVEFEDFEPNTRFGNIDEYAETYIKGDEEVYENLQKNGLPDRMLYERYMQKFNYCITPKFENEDAVFNGIDIFYYSGELDRTNSGEHVNNTMRAKPKKIILEWSTGTDKYGGYIWTDENKIIETFANFFGDDTQKTSSFVIEIGEANDKFKIYLQDDNSTAEISLEDNIQMIVFKNRLECYRSPSYNKPPGSWRF